jgi:hypothetical protein
MLKVFDPMTAAKGHSPFMPDRSATLQELHDWLQETETAEEMHPDGSFELIELDSVIGLVDDSRKFFGVQMYGPDSELIVRIFGTIEE